METLPLDHVEQPNPPPRPTLADESVRRAAAEALMPEIIRWLGKDWQEAEREDYIEDLMEVAHVWDGYQAARLLESRSHWSPDQELVEILGGADGPMAADRAIEAWVAANNITPKLAIGDTVRARPRGGIGPIVNIDAAHATYTVATTDFFREYPDQAGKGGGIVVAFEDCALAATSEAPNPQDTGAEPR